VAAPVVVAAGPVAPAVVVAVRVVAVAAPAVVAAGPVAPAVVAAVRVDLAVVVAVRAAGVGPAVPAGAVDPVPPR
jgi:hypothetical protein